LICHIRFLGGVTEAEQGWAATTAERMVKKADQGTKSWPETTAATGINDQTKQESQWQIKLTERPIRRREEPSELPERAKSTNYNNPGS